MLKAALVLLIFYVTIGRLKVKYYDRKYDAVEIQNEYDFIVVGAGTSGSVVATRLSENPNTTVLLLEAGGSGRGEAFIDVPGLRSNLDESVYDWGYKTLPAANLNNKVFNYPRGKVAGGTSAINYMVYIRGTKYDYDTWQDMGAAGWGYDDVLPFFQKIEQATERELHPDIGRNGKLKLSAGYSHEPLYDFIAKTSKEIGYALSDYFTSDGMAEGISRVTSSILDGVRQSSASSYLFRKLDSGVENLHLSLHTFVHKLLIKEEAAGLKKAHGVRFERKGRIGDVRARKEVIVCTGALNTPKLLMLSGIGPREHLQEKKVDVVVDLPGVGSNLEDHVAGYTWFYGKNLPDNITWSKQEVMGTFPDFARDEISPMATVALVSAVGHFVTNSSEYGNRDIQIYFTAEKLTKEDLPLAVSFLPNVKKELQEADLHQDGVLVHFRATVALLNVASRGSVRLSSNNPHDKPVIDPGYLKDDEDMKRLIAGYRILEKFEMSDTFMKYGIKLALQPLCSQHELTNIPRSDEFYKCAVMHSVSAFLHPTSTAKIGSPDDNMAVVDPRLRVYGMKGLRVADASVMPKIVAANTQATCYMIGEKAASMIKEDWQL